MIGNLIDNALEALAGTPQPREVHVHISDRDGIDIIVADTGPGVDAAEIHRVFDDGYTTKTGRGEIRRGLGLALVHRIVRRAGGTIEVSSGPGARFHVTLPIPDARPRPRGRVRRGARMIRTLVVEDDYRVARIHRASIERLEGFTCVGEAHTAAQAREIIADTQPDLLLLDVYLPDEDGLSLLRSLSSAGTHRPDCIVVTASRDLQTIGSAMQSGAIYYLVKPFGFVQLRDQLEAYRRWRARLDSPEEADQETVDQLYSLLRSGHSSVASRRLPPTMQKVLDAVLDSDQPVDALRVAKLVGVSRPTAQRYLAELEHRRYVELELDYGSTGRPVHLYRAESNSPDRRRERPPTD